MERRTLVVENGGKGGEAQDLPGPFDGVRGGKGNHGGVRFEDSEDPGNPIDGSFNMQANQGSLRDAGGEEAPCDPVGPGIQLPEGNRTGSLGKGFRVGGSFRLLLEICVKEES